MTSADDVIQYRKLRAPREHGATLVDPPWEAVSELLPANRAALNRAANCDLQGRSLHELSRAARQSLLQLAHEPPDATSPIILTGHQPHLFHPGVWFKNFALSSLARHFSARAINLVVDNDTIRHASIRVPTGTPTQPRLAVLPFDAATEEVPFEQRRILDAATWDSFAARVRDAIRPLVDEPLVEQLWPTAIDARRRGEPLGAALAGARRRLEDSWGLAGADVPLSHVCDSPPFLWFAAHLLAQLPRLRQVYNEALEEYRRVHGVRSRSHPVPGLADEHGWLEAPLWIWTDETPRRSRLFARRIGGQVEVTDRGGCSHMIDLPDDGDASNAVEQLLAWRAAGVKIRPRALMTTLFARLLLSDLFLHGIGGAKYDQLTDAIARRFLGIELPRFQTLTATLTLPIPHAPTTAHDVLAARQRLREMTFHPERFLPDAERLAAATNSTSASADTSAFASIPTSDVRPPSRLGELTREECLALVARKHEWLARQLPRGERLERHRAIVDVNAALQPALEGLRASWRATSEQLAIDAAHHALLASREFSYCLFPAQLLRAHLLELSALPR